MRKKQLDPNLSEKDLGKLAYATSIRMLAVREHSCEELRRKLSQRGFESALVESTLQQMIDAGYQSDERFATLYAEQLSNRNYGPLSIRAKLASRGISGSESTAAISAAIATLKLTWAEVACNALLAKFSADALADSDELQRHRIARFLNNRGFSSTDSIKAITLARETVSEVP